MAATDPPTFHNYIRIYYGSHTTLCTVCFYQHITTRAKKSQITQNKLFAETLRNLAVTTCDEVINILAIFQSFNKKEDRYFKFLIIVCQGNLNSALEQPPWPVRSGVSITVSLRCTMVLMSPVN